MADNNINHDGGSIVASASDEAEIKEINEQNETQLVAGQGEEVETPTADILEWRAKMEAMESPNANRTPAIRRWYFNESGSDSDRDFDTSDKPTQPQAITEKKWCCDIPMIGIQFGCYELIMCVSLKGINMGAMRSITLDYDLLLEDGSYYFPNQESKTKIEKEELLSLHPIVFGSGRPDQIVSVGPRNPGISDCPVTINAYGISDTGDYAATLYFEDDFAYIEVWDIRAQNDSNNLPTQPHVVSVPLAQTRIELEESQDVNVEISNMGTHVAIGSDDVPFQLFKSVPPRPADKDLFLPWDLEKSDTICDRNRYVSMFFYRRDRNNSNEEDERFFTTDRHTFAAYNIQGKWTQLYSVQSQLYSVQSQLGMRVAIVRMSIQGSYFAWVTEIGEVSIWDFETGQLVSHIYIGAENQIGDPCISPDGTMVAIPVKNTIQIRDTLTGVKLGVFKKGLSNDSIFEVVFGKEYFITYDSGKSTSKKLGEHNARSVDCKRNTIKKFEVPTDLPYKVTNRAGTKFIISCQDLFKREEFITELEIKVDGETGTGGSRAMKIPLGPNDLDYEGFFIPVTSQLVLITNGFVQIWNLSATATRLCELALIWKFQEYPDEVEETDYCMREIVSAAVCEHCKNIRIDLAAAKWYSEFEDYPLKVANQNPDTLTIPITKDDTFKSVKDDTFKTVEERRTNQGFLGLIPLYVYGENDCKESVIHFMKQHIRPTVRNPTSCLLALCDGWTPQNKADIEKMVIEILPKDHITWIPRVPLIKKKDPLALILKIARIQPTAITIAKAIMDYCVSRAVRSRDLAFLSPLFGSLREVMKLAPEAAIECFGRIALIPVMHHSYIVSNCIVAQPPTFRLKFWEPIDKPLSETKDPIMQLDIVSSYQSRGKSNDTQEADELQTVQTTTWWETLYHMIRLKTSLQIRNYVECHDFNIEFFDNPAIAALVSYKW
ncbi:hypothetical protein BGX20_010910 [Mortierella sp. AD010]|nr:hypothetical protein BGX20_010910 [Mortierella sp. AD010]